MNNLMPPTATAVPILPARLKQPFMLLWLWLLPQAVLLLLNLRAWTLASGEATVDQAFEAQNLGLGALALLLAGVGLWALAALRRRPVGLGACLFGLIVNIAYLWLFMERFDHAWPRAVADWMLPQTEVVFYQFALVMPALFYCGLRLACIELKLERGLDIGLSLGMFVAVPFGWYALFHLVDLFTHRFFRGMFEGVGIVFFAGSTVLVMLAFLRLLTFLYTWLAAKPWGTTAMTAASGLLFPVAGLLLNARIPFPCDFQSVSVYVLTVLNGALLIVPLSPRNGPALLTWWARSAFYLFSLYFFLVFLPFMPLSLLAMIACGAGFLILAPTLLFIIHTRRLAADGRALAARAGRLPVIGLFALGIATLPALFLARAAFDRHALTRAMDIVFSPDLTQSRNDYSPRTVARALANLRDTKDGIFVPFVSDAYNRLVFNGMVLTDEKLDVLARSLLGRPAVAANKADRFSLFLTPHAATRWGGTANVAPPPRTVTLDTPVIDAATTSNGVTRTLLRLPMANTGAPAAEFVGRLSLPDGVLVSGFWLDVAGTRKPGMIVEKKTALWVYHMIRDYTRRDPGLLVYEPDGTLKLSVFPFGAAERRTVWIEFMAPAALRARVHVNGMAVALSASPAAGTDAVPAIVPEASACVVPPAALAQFPTAPRSPIVRFIMDRSAVATNPVAIPPELGAAAGALGGRCRVTLANVESLDTDLAPQSPADAAERALLPHPFPPRGGFCPDRVIARHLLDVPDNGATVPVFVVVPAPGSTPVRTLDLAPYACLAPDVPGYYLWTSNHLEWVAYVDGRHQPVEALASPAPVVLFRASNQATAVLPGDNGAIIDLEGPDGTVLVGTNNAPSLDVYNPESGTFEAVPSMASLDHAAYAAGLRLFLDSRAVRANPASVEATLPTLVGRSAKAGILCPFTSFIVVENSAQEKTLLARQKQALGSHQALEFEDKSVKSPEPGLVWLLPAAWLILGWRRRRARQA